MCPYWNIDGLNYCLEVPGLLHQYSFVQRSRFKLHSLQPIVAMMLFLGKRVRHFKTHREGVVVDWWHSGENSWKAGKMLIYFRDVQECELRWICAFESMP